MSYRNFLVGFFVGGILIACCAVGFYLIQSGFITFNLNSPEETQKIGKKLTEASFAEDLQSLEDLEDIDPSFGSMREFFVTLAKDNGGVYAFEVLKRAVLPLNTDLHLLGHAVGDELYKQENLEGMQHCTHDFRNACSHSIVVGALLAEGMDVFDKVNEVCKLSPGGSGAYTMCFHGFGHGVLAYTGYEVPEAVKLCGKVGTDEYHDEEEAQCIGGMIMEMHQGIHDPEIWEQKKDKYLSIDDPLRLCKADYMPEIAKVLCYSYITPYIFDSAGAVNGNPRPEIYAKSFAYCDEVEVEEHRLSCYGGLGKEFVVLAQDRDIRKMEDTPDEKLKLSASWCALAPKSDAERACLMSILDSLYWGGENDPQVSIRYCSVLDKSTMQQACFEHLFSITTFYQPNPSVRREICDATPVAYRVQCERVLIP